MHLTSFSPPHPLSLCITFLISDFCGYCLRVSIPYVYIKFAHMYEVVYILYKNEFCPQIMMCLVVENIYRICDRNLSEVVIKLVMFTNLYS